MSSCAVFSINQFPLEILHRIFYYLDIPDISRIRRASRYLNEATYCRNVWHDAYRTAEFFRPPGPFPSQSAHYLESILVTSFRVDQNLRNACGTGQTLGVQVKTDSVCGHRSLCELNLWAAPARRFDDEIHCLDLNLDNPHADIVYRRTGGRLMQFDCVSAVDVEGHPFACVVLNESTQTTGRISIYSLNVGETFEVTFHLLHQFERTEFYHNSVLLGPRILVVQRKFGPEFDTEQRLVALDVHTRTEFLLLFTPPFTLIEMYSTPTSISTSTHLLLACSYLTDGGWVTFFQAFALPPSDTSGPATTLRPSHSSTISHIRAKDIVLVRDSVLDPATQDILIDICVEALDPNCSWFIWKHGVLHLSTAPPSTSHDREIGTVTFQPCGDFLWPQPSLFHPFLDGTGWIFSIYQELSSESHMFISALEYSLRTSGHDDGEQEVKVVIHDCPPIARTSRSMCDVADYDPYSCRICLKFTEADCSEIDILNLAV